MSMVRAAQTRVYMADGGFSHPVDRGRFVGGGMVWDEDRYQLRDYHSPVPIDPAVLAGVVYDQALEACTLAWRVAPQDIDLTMWEGALNSVSGQRQRPLERGGSTLQGLWRVVRPGGNHNVSVLQQYHTGLEFFQVTSLEPLRRNPKFAVAMYREQTPGDEVYEPGMEIPYIYTGVTFGETWALQLPKWRPAELYKRVNGKWRLVAIHDWMAQELYGDSYGEREQLLVIMAIDNKLVIRGSVVGDPWVYTEPTPISVKATPVQFHGNGGAATFGLHQVEFAQGEQRLVARRPTTLDRSPAAALESVTTGSKPAGTRAGAYMGDKDGNPLTGKPRSFYVSIALESEDGQETPVLRCGGLRAHPVTTAGPQRFLDVSARFIGGSGGWELDLQERVIKQQYRVELDNEDGALGNLRANKLVSIALGRPGSEAAGAASSWVAGGPAQKVLSISRIDEDAQESFAARTLTLVTIDRMEVLEEVECGERAPQDGLTVATAMREALSWGHVRPEEIGEIYDSGTRLPTSLWAGAYDLAAADKEVGGVVDVGSGAACRPRPEASVRSWLRYLMSYDYNTFAVWDDTGKYRYLRLSPQVMRRFRAVESPAAEDEIRRDRRRRPRLNEGGTSVVVGGRERSTGRPLSSRACDINAWGTVGSPRFRGWDVTIREDDESLNEQRLVNLRCRYRFEWLRAMRDVESIKVIGQRLLPSWRVAVDGQEYWLMSVQEQWDAGGRWEMDLDLVRAT
jgi:hypothetical protein